MAGVSFLEILADHSRIADRKFAVDHHRDPAQRTKPPKLVIAIEGSDRVNLIVEPLEVHAGEHLAHVRTDEAADDRDHGIGLSLLPWSRKPKNLAGHAATVALHM